MTPIYEAKIKHILESLGTISPFVSRSQPVNAASGTNQGMTDGDMLNTFPSSLKSIKVDLPKKKKRIKQRKTDQ